MPILFTDWQKTIEYHINVKLPKNSTCSQTPHKVGNWCYRNVHTSMYVQNYKELSKLHGGIIKSAQYEMSRSLNFSLLLNYIRIWGEKYIVDKVYIFKGFLKYVDCSKIAVLKNFSPSSL